MPGFPVSWLWDGAKPVGQDVVSKSSRQRGFSTMSQLGRRSYSTNARRLEEIASNEDAADDLIAPATSSEATSSEPAASVSPTSSPPYDIRQFVADSFPKTNSEDGSAITTLGDLQTWRERSKHRPPGEHGNQYSGRTVKVRPSAGGATVASAQINSALRSLNVVLSRNKIKKELRLGEFYEKPSERRQRLARERHRRRFQDMVRKKVQLVQQLRSRP